MPRTRHRGITRLQSREKVKLDDMKALNLRHAPTVENGLAHAPMSMPNPGPDQPGHIHEDCCK